MFWIVLILIAAYVFRNNISAGYSAFKVRYQISYLHRRLSAFEHRLTAKESRIEVDCIEDPNNCTAIAKATGAGIKDIRAAMELIKVALKSIYDAIAIKGPGISPMSAADKKIFDDYIQTSVTQLGELGKQVIGLGGDVDAVAAV